MGSEPSSTYNADGQVRTRTCTPLLLPTAALRFPDGTPTGFYAYGDDPSKNGSAPDCTAGQTEIDAQETLTNSTGMEMFFRPGGGPDQYVDPVNKGQYGHIWSAELASRPTLQPLGLNGHSCAGIAPGTDPFVINFIGVSDDGAIYAANLSASNSLSPFVLYRWASETATQTVVFSGDPGQADTNGLKRTWGNTLAVRGAGTNTQVVIGSRDDRLAILTPADSSMTSFTAKLLQTDLPAGALADGLAFGDSNTFWVASGPAGSGQLYHLSFDLIAGTATTLRAFSAAEFPATVSAVALASSGNLLGGIDTISGPDLLRLYDCSNPTNPPALLDRKAWPVANDNVAFSGSAAFAGTNRLYALDSDNGIVAFNVAVVTSNPLPPLIYLQPTNLTVPAGAGAVFVVSADGTAPLSYQWRFNGQNITVATGSILNFASAQGTNAGAYNVVVTNAVGNITSSIVTLTVTGAAPAPALSAYEPFNYATNSVLAGQGGWLLNSGSSGTIQSGNLLVPGLAPASGNHFAWTSSSMSVRLPVNANSNGSLYFSFAMRVSSLGTAASDTLAGFTTGTSTTYSPKINIASNSVGTYSLGIYKGSGLTVGSTATIIFATNDTVFVVARYTFNPGATNDDTCDLWLNPPSNTFGSANPPTATIAGVGLGAGKADSTQIDRFSFRSAAPALQCEADELRVGTTWASVTPPDVPALAISLNGNVATLRWSTNAAGFVLEQSASFSGNWTANSNAATIAGTNNIVTVMTTNGALFYRLRR